ncbi:MAG: rRNA adenine dimethyltransferase family protein, partial [Clostridia bacterium]
TPIKIIENNFNGQPYKIVANIPYNITSPLLMKFLEESTNVTSVTLMVQKEVAERLVAKPSSSNYGALTVVVAYFGTAKICRIVSKNMFTPRPKVDSAIINIKLFQKTKDNNFAFVVKSAFSNRRKTLVNNLSQSFNLTKNQVEEILEQQNIPKCARGETLTVQDFQKLSQKISEIKRLDKTC